MRDKLKGAVLGALVAACATVLLAQTPPWTAPITWTTGDLLTASQFNAQFRDNLLNLRGFAACAETGITGTASADTVLFGDCRWDDIPATTVVALDMGDTTTTAMTFQTFGPSASLAATSGQTITAYFSGDVRIVGSTSCEFRVYNSTTATAVLTHVINNPTYSSVPAADSSPSTTSENTYVTQLRRSSTSPGSCRSRAIASPIGNRRGMIAVVTG